MGARSILGGTLAVGFLTTACLSGPPAHEPAVPAPAIDAGGVATVTLRYRRPEVFASAGRPEAFHVIADYLGASTERRYPGSWNEPDQTLSASVTVPLRLENLVYVVDSAIQPGATTTISASRGQLKEIPCPQDVNPLYTCDVLQILH